MKRTQISKDSLNSVSSPLPSLPLKMSRYGLTLIIGCAFTWACTPSSSTIPADPVQKELTPQSKAESLILKAWKYESEVTGLLRSFSKSHNITLQGLEHRLKTHSSAVRKVRQILAKNPKLKVDDVTISDTLRYTFEVKDDPAGHYVEVITEVLKLLKERGFEPSQVKNYWPKGDNYSGVNMVLKDKTGFEWELQIHTPKSFAEKTRTHSMYERLRDPKTPLADRQQLFDQMASPWDAIPIPKDVLKEKNLHSAEVIKTLSRP
jgi:hypothetical protein